MDSYDTTSLLTDADESLPSMMVSFSKEGLVFLEFYDYQ